MKRSSFKAKASRTAAQQKHWNQLRHDVWRRDEGRCVVCGWHADFETNYECHHRRYRSRQGLDQLANCVTLCRECHGDVHRNGANSLTTGWSVSAAGLPPEQIPVHYWDGTDRLLTNDETSEAA